MERKQLQMKSLKVDYRGIKEKLTNSAQALFTKMYENMQQAQGGAGPDMSGFNGAAGSDANGTSSTPEDDVIDGDFREV